MKKTGLLIVALLIASLWVNSHRNELSVWFNSDSFYKPIFTDKFDVLRSGYRVSAELESVYDVRHGFFLTFPCDNLPTDFFADLDGSVHYTIKSGDIVLTTKTISPPQHPMGGLDTKGCNILLFTFDLPFEGHNSVTLEVVVSSPITKLAPYQPIRCEVSPAYWPK